MQSSIHTSKMLKILCFSWVKCTCKFASFIIEIRRVGERRRASWSCGTLRLRAGEWVTHCLVLLAVVRPVKFSSNVYKVYSNLSFTSAWRFSKRHWKYPHLHTVFYDRDSLLTKAKLLLSFSLISFVYLFVKWLFFFYFAGRIRLRRRGDQE